MRDGYRIALIGAPNAGKSSIINMLAARDVAIVDPTPGTTRDIVEAVLTVAGYRVVLSDTAGLRESDDAVETEGARRATVAAETAALRLWVVDGSVDTGGWRAAESLVRDGDVCLLNKLDLPRGKDGDAVRARAAELGAGVLDISATGGQTELLLSAIRYRVTRDLSGAEFPAATRVRHSKLLKESADHVGRALLCLKEPELAAEDVRLAARAMERITGKVNAEDVLDRVFSTFCIGK